MGFETLNCCPVLNLPQSRDDVLAHARHGVLHVVHARPVALDRDLRVLPGHRGCAEPRRTVWSTVQVEFSVTRDCDRLGN